MVARAAGEQQSPASLTLMICFFWLMISLVSWVMWVIGGRRHEALVEASAILSTKLELPALVKALRSAVCEVRSSRLEVINSNQP